MSSTRKIASPYPKNGNGKNGRPKVLVVEDEVALGRIVAKILGKAHDVVLAHEGNEAARLITSRCFDAVLSDVILPGISGIDLLRLVRTYDLDVPFVLMTGHPKMEDIRQAMELGAIGYLEKPIDMSALEACIARACTLGRLAREKRKALEIVKGGPPTMGIGDKAGLEARLDKALGGLYLAFQPIADIRRKRVVAFEALMRSDEPALPTPLAILDAAEQLDAVEVVGRRVRELAAQAVPTLPVGADLFVNVHTRELLDERLYGASCPLAAHAARVVLEVTERERVDHIADVTDRVSRLRTLGFRLAVDDLGAGYAGLTCFSALEPEVVKIDRALVHGISSSITCQRVVKSIIGLCREMSIRVVAEGVEVASDLAIVSDLGVDLVQGYVLGKPSKRPIARVPMWWSM